MNTFPSAGAYNQQLAAIQNQLMNLQTAPVPSWQYAPQQTMTPQPEVPAQQSQFVTGMDGARAYLRSMPPNSSATVFDNNEDVFYALKKDANGIASPIKKCPFTVEEENENSNDYVTKKDFEAFKTELKQFLENKHE